MNPLRNNLEIFAGTRPAYYLPLWFFFRGVVFYDKSSANQTPLSLIIDADLALKHARKRGAVNEFFFSILTPLVRIVVGTALSSMLNTAAAKEANEKSCLKSWSFQNDYNYRIGTYFTKKLVYRYIRIPPSWLAPFLTTDASEQELKHIFSHSSDTNYNGGKLDFKTVFVDTLQRDAIDCAGLAAVASVGALLCHIPAIRRILQPPEAVYAAQLQEKIELYSRGLLHPRNLEIDVQNYYNRLNAIFVEQAPTVGQTVARIGQAFYKYAFLLLLKATVCGLVRSAKTYESDERGAEIEHIFGKYGVGLTYNTFGGLLGLF